MSHDRARRCCSSGLLSPRPLPVEVIRQTSECRDCSGDTAPKASPEEAALVHESVCWPCASDGELVRRPFLCGPPAVVVWMVSSERRRTIFGFEATSFKVTSPVLSLDFCGAPAGNGFPSIASDTFGCTTAPCRSDITPFVAGSGAGSGNGREAAILGALDCLCGNAARLELPGIPTFGFTAEALFWMGRPRTCSCTTAVGEVGRTPERGAQTAPG
mmetsp:Transcript_62977/g.181150  ORF Transcript_62977/g.181150 Transcript_62977/m.181150 type:complete len:216 (+) Transcript_62977:606-1253(+)